MAAKELFALLIKKVGSEWCLFTADGARELGCHPTKADAEAQEAAIKSREAQATDLCTNKDNEGAVEIAAALAHAEIPLAHGTNFIADEAKRGFLVKQFETLGGREFVTRYGSARVVALYAAFGSTTKTCETKAAGHSRDATLFCGALAATARSHGAGKSPGYAPIYLFDSKIDIKVAKEMSDGSARMDVRLAPEGKDFENAGRDFNLTKVDLEAGIANFQKRGGPVPVTIGHWPDEERQRQPAVAWIERLFRATIDGEKFLMAQMRYLKDTWERIKKDEFKFLSMEFWTNDTDQHGNEIGLNIDGAAILNYPFFPLRFDQSRRRGGFFMTCSSIAPSGRRTMEKDPKKKLQEGEHEIKEVEGEFCVFDPAGENLGCWPTREEAEAKLAEVVGATKPAEGEGEAGKGGDGETVTIPKAEYDELRQKGGETLRKKGGGESHLQLRVTKLEKENAAKDRSLKCSRIRAAVEKLRRDFKVQFKLGDYKGFEHDDAATEKFLADRPWGVSDVEGLEKLATDFASCAHLPKAKTGGEKPGGSDADGAEPDVLTEDGRAHAVKQRVMALRKEFGAEEIETHCKRRRQTVEEYAREELNNEHPKAGFIKAAK